MSVQAVRDYLQQFGLADRVLEFSVSSATVALAAEALGCEGSRIAKTLSFLVEEQAVLIVAAGDAKIDNRKYKDFFHAKAKMLSAEELSELVGHAPGGVCPFAVPPSVRVYLDLSLQRFETVYPACGSASSAIPLSCEELARCAKSLGWVDLCKDWQEG